MKTLSATFIFFILTISIFGQSQDSLYIENDSISFAAPNAFLTTNENYETFNNSLITGSSFATIRGQDNPRLSVDGVPMNPIFINNMQYSEFMGSMHLLSYDLQKSSVSTLSSDGKITSGNYNNAINFETHDIELGKKKLQFELNNFTTIAYQDFDTIGYSTVTNVNTQRSYEKFGYRFSFSNGFQNDYIPEKGLQRYSANLKSKYKYNEKILLTGFLDYSKFRDFNRTGDNNLKSNRLLTYLNADVDLTDQFRAYGKLGLSRISDVSQRGLEQDGESVWSGEPYSESYFEKNDFKYNSSFLDFGLNFNELVLNGALLSFNLGYSFYRNKYHIGNENRYEHSTNLSSSYSRINFEPKTTEKKLYSSLKLSNKFLSIQYLFNKTNYGLNQTFFKGSENRGLSNHVLLSNFDIINNDNKLLNKLGIQLNLGKLSNYSVIVQPVSLTPGIEQPQWITEFDNSNVELNLYSSFLKNKVDINFSVYHKFYDSYDRFFQSGAGGWIIAKTESIGEITKNGFDVNADFHIIQRKKINWLVSLSYSENFVNLDRGEDIMFWARPDITDTLINNQVVSLTNSFRFKNMELIFDFEGKKGYDINLYENNMSVTEPFGIWQQFQTVGVNNNGEPISERVGGNVPRIITDTDYFILKHIGLEYQINNSTKYNKYIIGFYYNKMRRLYLYVNDIDEYQDQFQKPSFYNTLSLSFKVKF